jgi:tripartite-type tricarboxylate transporter receptor subunit TctC
MIKTLHAFKAHTIALLTLTAALTHSTGSAQDTSWPAHPLRLIAGGAGGVTDVRARWLAERLAPALGRAVVVENKAGAGGNIGMELVARAAPDGYTLAIIHQGTMTINPHLYARTGYNALTDFTPLTRIGGLGPLVLAVHPDSPARSVADLIRLAKDKSKPLSYGSPGIGTPPHMAGELFKRLASIDAAHIPYKGGGQAASDLMAGHLSYTFEGTSVQLPLAKAGRIRALAVTGRERVPTLPDVPTMAEAGVPGYEFFGWVGIAVPAATPAPIVKRLYAEISKILAGAEAQAYFGEQGISAGGEAPDVFAADIRAEYAKWGELIRHVGLKAED